MGTKACASLRLFLSSREFSLWTSSTNSLRRELKTLALRPPTPPQGKSMLQVKLRPITPRTDSSRRHLVIGIRALSIGLARKQLAADDSSPRRGFARRTINYSLSAVVHGTRAADRSAGDRHAPMPRDPQFSRLSGAIGAMRREIAPARGDASGDRPSSPRGENVANTSRCCLPGRLGRDPARRERRSLRRRTRRRCVESSTDEICPFVRHRLPRSSRLSWDIHCKFGLSWGPLELDLKRLSEIRVPAHLTR